VRARGEPVDNPCRRSRRAVSVRRAGFSPALRPSPRRGRRSTPGARRSQVIFHRVIHVL
jgi:hypothetical protein